MSSAARPALYALAASLALSVIAGPVRAADALQDFVGRPAADLIGALGEDYERRIDDSGGEALHWHWRETVVDTGGRGPPETIVSGSGGRPSVATVPGDYRPPRAFFLECTVSATVEPSGTISAVTAPAPGCRRLLGPARSPP
jgi:hypothetical protein